MDSGEDDPAPAPDVRLSRTESNVLEVVSSYDSITAPEVARVAGVPPTAATAALQRLESEELIQSELNYSLRDARAAPTRSWAAQALDLASGLDTELYGLSPKNRGELGELCAILEAHSFEDVSPAPSPSPTAPAAVNDGGGPMKRSRTPEPRVPTDAAAGAAGAGQVAADAMDDADADADDDAAAAPSPAAAAAPSPDEEEAPALRTAGSKPPAPPEGWTVARLRHGEGLIAAANPLANGYLALPAYGLPADGDAATTAWTAPAPVRRAAPRAFTNAACRAAVDLALATVVALDPRTAANKYKVKYPDRIKRQKKRRSPGGDLWKAWSTCPEAAATAQLPLGEKVGLPCPDSFAGGLRLEPYDAMGLICADGCFRVTVRGIFGCQFSLTVEFALSETNIALLVALKLCIGSGTVTIFSCKHLGYYNKLRFEAKDNNTLRFLASHWRFGGVKAKQTQLANLALREARLGLGKGHGIPWDVGTPGEYAARDVLCFVMKNLKSADAVASTPANRALYSELFTAMSQDAFIGNVAFFLEGDGGCGIYEGRRSFGINFAQSDQGFLFALGDALAARGLVEVGDFHVTENPSSDNRATSHPRTRKAYEGRIWKAASCVNLARALVAVFKNRGAAQFPKAQKLALMVKYENPCAAACADFQRITD